MKVVIGNDHAGVDLKNSIVKYLNSLKIETTNVGTDTTNSVDYPDIAGVACEEFKKGGYDFGILICGTGIGISIAANKVSGIRAALLTNCFTAKMSKEHNNANFIAFGARMEYQDSIEDMIKTFIDTKFEGGRHNRRLEKIDKLSNL